MQKIFISYSRKDIDFARKLADDLENAGYDVWWDIIDLQGGDDWVRSIPAAIEASQYVIVVLTPNSVNSEWVQKEYTQALSLHKKIIPIMLVPSSVPFALNTINFINFASGEYADNFKKLLSPLGFTGTPPVVSPFIRSALSSLPPIVRKFGIPALIGIILLLAFILTPRTNQPEKTSTVTPTLTLAAAPTTTATSEHSTATPSATKKVTPTITSAITPTLFAPSTEQTFETLKLCINVQLDVRNINVRSGPGTIYAVLGTALDLDSCLKFRALTINELGETWLLIAPNQSDLNLKQYEGGWIRRNLLGQTGSIDLPVVTLTSTPTKTATFTITPSVTSSSTPTITSSPMETNTSSITPTATNTPTPTETDTPTVTDTSTP